jgi:predicted nuclease of predicted toxin-antitoxin system
MKFKVDENLPQEIAGDLVRLGHVADTVNDEGLAGADDITVVQAARASTRILLTLDKGIASLQRYPIAEQEGVVLFRPTSSGRGEVLSFLRLRLGVLLEMELAGHLTVVGPTRIRVR